MRLVVVLVSFLSLIFFQSYSQQLIINEVSQGTAGSEEYIELLVVGTPTCQTPVPCMDLRGIVLDDNNGYFATGSGSGIAPGALRFANNALWSCIPQGTLIVIYNNNERNTAIPPDDVSMTDGNCRLIIPVNSNLLEGQGTAPANGNQNYPASGTWTVGGGSWSHVGMANSGDSFQIRSSITATTPSHAVSYGNNTSNSIIYFSGSASGKVYYMANNTNNNPAIQANWTSGSAGTNETPGAPNNAANSVWIASMNPQCGTAANPLTANITNTPSGCGVTCTGTATASANGGTAPYSYAWSNGATTSTINSLCAGTYTVVVTDAGGCTTTAQTTIANTGNLTVTLTPIAESCAGACDGSITANTTGGTAPFNYTWSDNSSDATISNKCVGNYSVSVVDQNGCTGTASAVIQAGAEPTPVSILSPGSYSTNDTPIQLTASILGGTWTADCGTCISANGIFNPQNAGAGTYQICYTIGSGACQSQDCKAIEVTGCTAQNTQETETICPGDSILVNGQYLTTTGAHPFVFLGQNGCDSTHTIMLNFFVVNPIYIQETICMGDSIEISGVWYMQNDNIIEPIVDFNGCATTKTTQIVFNDCSIEDYAVFIPNVFTPNNDQINDVFSFQIMGGLLAEGYIVNRWGNIIKQFAADDLNWNGTTNDGLPVPDGVYTYVIIVDKNGGGRERLHGFVSVLR